MARIGIAGGGLGGLTLAVALQRQGADVIVFERQSEIRDAGAGISLWPNAVAALDLLDLGELLRTIGRELSSGGMRRSDGKTAATFSSKRFLQALGGPLVCVERGPLVAALAEMLSPGTIRTDACVSGFTVHPPGVTVQFADGSDLEVDALVGADGINSSVASQLAGPLRFTYSGYTAWRGIAQMDTDPDDHSFWAWLEFGYEFGWLPLPRGRAYWFATASVPEAHAFPDDDTHLYDLFGSYPDPVPRLLARTNPDQRVRSDIVDRSLVRHISKGPVTLVGDAAHPMRPHLGQGGCQAIEDAAVLSRCLLSAASPTEAFQRYASVRSTRTKRIVRLSRRSSFTRPRGWKTAAFDRASALMTERSIGPALRFVAPIAGYRAGVKAVGSA